MLVSSHAPSYTGPLAIPGLHTALKHCRYAALADGKLEQLLKAGYRYMFVSNSDNLGATLDVPLLARFAAGDSPFVLEVGRLRVHDPTYIYPRLHPRL